MSSLLSNLDITFVENDRSRWPTFYQKIFKLLTVTRTIILSNHGARGRTEKPLSRLLRYCKKELNVKPSGQVKTRTKQLEKIQTSISNYLLTYLFLQV
ncbi:unnamed protein product [Amoebophrya sp. A25]|nr:unnamed protein product [Amoebophrya sp. A25]|eukprot:GSA25T00006198001.1